MVDGQRVLESKKRLVRMHFENGVGHLGGNLSSLDFLMVLFHDFLQDQDKFVLSKGHSAGALYVALWSKGLLTDQELDTFHQEGTFLPGHPPCRGIKEIDFGTGSLGHGLSLAAGLALASKIKGLYSNIYCLMSDGEWQEGSSWEALIFCAHHKLSNLTVVIDQNNLQGFGKIDEVASMSNLKEKFLGFNVEVLEVNGHDLLAINNGLKIRIDSKPKILILKTIKGKGISFLENRMESHYLPLTRDQFESALKELNK